MISILKDTKEYIYNKLTLKVAKINRTTLSYNYINGTGIEIGALNFPLKVRPKVTVQYLDRVSADSHMNILDEFKRSDIVDVDIIDDGETLKTVPNESQDFIIANHFIEHCQNVILTIENMLRVIRPCGILFMAIPDKRYTFDKPRVITSFEHLLRDYHQGTSWSEEEHYLDFVKNTDHGLGKTDAQITTIIQQLKNRNFSIHFHVWDHQAMIEMFCNLKKQLLFPIEIQLAIAASEKNNESIFILKKI